MIWYVDANAVRSGMGTKEYPFRRIQEAACLAGPGDEVLVAPGVYREHVDPKQGGRADARIAYRSLEPLGAVITGAEEIRGWTKTEGSVWTVRVPNSLFGAYNPFTTLVSGDWFIAMMTAHTGDVYLNGKSMYEVTELKKVLEPEVSMASWDRDFSLYTWYTEQDTEQDETVLYANFHDLDPNRENVEISVRANCFYPNQEEIGYITLSGFTVCKAATQWAPPTAYQEGMIGPHWSKGWIIEDCEVYESKCSGISLGKYLQPENDNKWLKQKYKDGTQTERDCICQAQREGWSKEKIGSHIIRRCNIHDCGQTGIVGHLGGVFSLIEDNHIHHINNKQNLAGAEIGGIKMHAAIDVVFRRNHIHHCTRGLWLDWQAQGTRVTQNLFHHNTLPNLEGLENPPREAFLGTGEDVFIEVSHGPTLLDNNFFLSTRAVKLATQGVAMVNNLVAGALTAVGTGTDNGAPNAPSPRYTPYHVPHETWIAGFMTFLHGDDRFYNNIFVQQPVHPALKKAEENSDPDNRWDDGNVTVGTHPFNGYPTFAEWDAMFEGYCGMGSVTTDRYYAHLPVWAANNLYLNGARSWEKEQNPMREETPVTLALEERDGAWVLETNLFDLLDANAAPMMATEALGRAFEPEQAYENPDGSPILFREDYFGNDRGIRDVCGPLTAKDAVSPLKLW